MVSFSSYLIKVWYDLIEEAQTLQTIPVGAALAVELFELRLWDFFLRIWIVIKLANWTLLKTSNSIEKW